MLVYNRSTGVNRHRKSKEGSFLRAFFGLAFLEPREIEDCIVEDFGPLAPKNDKIVEFVDYILNTYVCSGALFPPDMWAGCRPRAECL